MIDSPYSASTRRILAVDDDPEALALIGSLLTGAGYKVSCKPDLRAARAALSRESYNLVLTDLYLGEETLGYEIAEIARAQRPPVPVILLTARPSLANAHEAMRSRICEIVVKPIDGASLVSACRKAIDECEIRRRNAELEAQIHILEDVLPRCIEANDPMTKGHSERVVLYADVLAKKCGIAESDREALRLAALLHDVGKIGIPGHILGKEGPLTADERQIIQRHPQVGYEILEPLRGYENARLWVYQHHERWDGRGYPLGLAGEEVAMPGRILILAEVFDALASPRSYKPAWELPAIVEFFRREAGKHFDPDLAHMVADGLETTGTRFFTRHQGRLF